MSILTTSHWLVCAVGLYVQFMSHLWQVTSGMLLCVHEVRW